MLSIRISLVPTILLSIFLFQILNAEKLPPELSAKHYPVTTSIVKGVSLYAIDGVPLSYSKKLNRYWVDLVGATLPAAHVKSTSTPLSDIWFVNPQDTKMVELLEKAVEQAAKATKVVAPTATILLKFKKSTPPTISINDPPGIDSADKFLEISGDVHSAVDQVVSKWNFFQGKSLTQVWWHDDLARKVHRQYTITNTTITNNGWVDIADMVDKLKSGDNGWVDIKKMVDKSKAGVKEKTKDYFVRKVIYDNSGSTQSPQLSLKAVVQKAMMELKNKQPPSNNSKFLILRKGVSIKHTSSSTPHPGRSNINKFKAALVPALREGIGKKESKELELIGSYEIVVLLELEKTTEKTKKVSTTMPAESELPVFMQGMVPSIEVEFIRSVLKREIQSLETEYGKQIAVHIPEPGTCAESMKHCELIRYCTTNTTYADRNILALDKTRVELTFHTKTHTHDYINANEVKPIVDLSLPPNHSQQLFIATQAPIVTAYADGYGAKQPMVVDFWRMILQERASTIVMLAQIGDMTKTGESVPIHVYWPMEKDDTMTDLDGISVKNLGVRDEKDFIVTTLEVKHSNARPLEVEHYRYLNWEDMKVPDLMILFKLLDEILKRSPIVVHCSAGVGRAGTLISIAHGIMQFRNQRPIDVKNIVLNLRNQRPSSVQKDQQYVFIYMTLLHYAAKTNPAYEAQVAKLYKEFLAILEERKQAKKKASEVSTIKPAETTSVHAGA